MNIDEHVLPNRRECDLFCLIEIGKTIKQNKWGMRPTAFQCSLTFIRSLRKGLKCMKRCFFNELMNIYVHYIRAYSIFLLWRVFRGLFSCSLMNLRVGMFIKNDAMFIKVRD